MIVKKTILTIIKISSIIGTIASLADLFSKKKNEHKPFGPYEMFVKRGLDAFFATGAIVVLSPFLLIIALLVRKRLGSPIIFTQDRPGRDGKVFKLYKFRTMTDEVDDNGALLSDEARSTKFGSLLRSMSLDELPEIINIIKGDMSIVGPRPLLIDYIPYYSKTEMHRHDVRPGLTGLAQINGRSYLTWEQIFQYDLDYVENVTFVEDVRIIVKTIKKVLMREDIADTSNTQNNDSGRRVHKPLDVERRPS